MCWLSKLFGSSIGSEKTRNTSSPKGLVPTSKPSKYNNPKGEEVHLTERRPKPSQATNKYPYD